MIFTYNGTDRNTLLEIEKIAGSPISFLERIKMGGNGSPKLFIDNFSKDLAPYFTQTQDRKFLNIELRAKGLILYFKNESNDYIYPIPYKQIELNITENKISIKSVISQITLVKANTKRMAKFINNLEQFIR